MPFLYHLIFPEKLDGLYNNVGIYWPVFTVVIILLIVNFLDILIKDFYFLNISKTPYLILNNSYINILLISAFLYTSAYFFINFTMSFRQTERISDYGFVAFSRFFLSTYFKVYLLFLIRKILLKEDFSKLNRIISLFIAISYLLGLNSSFDVLYISVSFFLFINKGKFFFSKKSNHIISFKEGLKYFFLIAIISLVLFVGVANKTGADNAKEVLTNISYSIHRLITRISTQYISVNTSLFKYLEDSSYIYSTFDGVFTEINRRFSKFFNYNVTVRNIDMWSVNRTNFLFLFKDISGEFTGASPGVIASVFFLPFFPLNFLIISLYIVFVLKRFDRIFKKSQFELTFLTSFFLVFFMSPLFDSPIDIINPFGLGFIYFFFFLGVTHKNRKYKYE